MLHGRLFLILGPSGSGKGTVIKYLREKFPEAVFPLSCTTRPPRPGEREGEAYFFVSREEFERRKAAGEFLEWATVHHDYMYGTLKGPILQALEEGKTVIREVDIQGVESIQKLLPPEQVITIFITAPSWENLRGRIQKRSSLPESELSQRQISFEREMEFAVQCDYVVMSEEGKIEEYCGRVGEIISSV